MENFDVELSEGFKNRMKFVFFKLSKSWKGIDIIRNVLALESLDLLEDTTVYNTIENSLTIFNYLVNEKKIIIDTSSRLKIKDLSKYLQICRKSVLNIKGAMLLEKGSDEVEEKIKNLKPLSLIATVLDSYLDSDDTMVSFVLFTAI